MCKLIKYLCNCGNEWKGGYRNRPRMSRCHGRYPAYSVGFIDECPNYEKGGASIEKKTDSCPACDPGKFGNMKKDKQAADDLDQQQYLVPLVHNPKSKVIPGMIILSAAKPKKSDETNNMSQKTGFGKFAVTETAQKPKKSNKSRHPTRLWNLPETDNTQTLDLGEDAMEADIEDRRDWVEILKPNAIYTPPELRRLENAWRVEHGRPKYPPLMSKADQVFFARLMN